MDPSSRQGDRQHFGLKRTQMPCQMMDCRMLARIDAKELDDLLAAFFIHWEAGQRCGNEPSRLQTPLGFLEHAQLAIDWQTMRATSMQTQRTHLLGCYAVTTGTVQWQCNVEEKEKEISARKPLITPVLVNDRIVTLDALHTQRRLGAQVQQYGEAYVLMAKDDQLTLVLQRDFTSTVPLTGKEAACNGSGRQHSCGAADRRSKPRPQVDPTRAEAKRLARANAPEQR